MKAKKKFYVAIVLAIFIVILLVSYLLYIPPLFDGPGYNIPGWIYNYFAYVYYSSRMEWLKNGGEASASQRAVAMAAWYRPDRMEELMGLNPDDLFYLGPEYVSLRLDNQAVRIFRAALSATLQQESKSLEIISYLAILGDWPGTTRATKELLEVHPESAEGNYWLGRALLEIQKPEEALFYLDNAYRIDPALVDSLFRMGQANESLEETDKAINQYEQVVEIIPSHLGSWKSLKKLYNETGEIKKYNKAFKRCNELTPEISLVENYENKIIFFGFDSPEKNITTGQEQFLNIYVKGFLPRKLVVKPIISLDDGISYSKKSRLGRQFLIKTAGEVVKRSMTWYTPLSLFPGNSIMEITFRFPDLGITLEEKKNRWKFLPLTSFSLTPEWTNSPRRDNLVREHFGEFAQAVNIRTFLGPDKELSYRIVEHKDISAIALITFIIGGYDIHQGRQVARVELRTEEGKDLLFPIKMGEQTGCRWREGGPKFSIKHQNGNIFSKTKCKQGEKELFKCDYYALLKLYDPLNLKTLTVKYTGDTGGLFIENIILIFSEE